MSAQEGIPMSLSSSNAEGGTPRSGSKPPLGSRTRRRSEGNLTSKGVRNNKRPSPSAGKESEDNSAEEKNIRTSTTVPGENNNVPVNIIQRPTKPRPSFDPLTLGTSVDPKSVRGIRGLELKNVGNLGLLTMKQLRREIVKLEKKEGISPSRTINRIKDYTKFKLMAELTARLPNEEKKALNARKRKAAKKREAELKAAAEAAEAKKAVWRDEREAKKAVAATTIQSRVRGIRNRKKVATMKAKAKAVEAKKALAAMSTAMMAAAVGTAKRSVNTEMEEYKEQMQLTVKKIQNREKAKTAAAIANANKRVEEQAEALDTAIRKYEEYIEKLKKGGKNLSTAMVKKNEKLALMKAEKNKQIALATKKLDELATKFAKRDNNFSKKNILDFISKSAKSNNRLTKKDILEFLSKQKTPTVTVKQSIGNVKAEGGKANVQISNSKKLNKEARLDQNIKRRDANYRRVVTTDPMVLKRQKRVFAKKRGELLKSIQKIIKSDRKTSPKIKKKVYDSYAKSPRGRISNLLKLPKKDLIKMIKRSTSRISK